MGEHSHIHKCDKCERMFLNENAKEDHMARDHEVAITPQSSGTLTTTPQEGTVPRSLYFVRVKSLWWPAESVANSRGEVIRMKIFNDNENELEHDVNNAKDTKHFYPLEKILKSCSKEWKSGYKRALEIYNSSQR